jgi:hypothetical protein
VQLRVSSRIVVIVLIVEVLVFFVLAHIVH